ncbi:MAG TPA: MBL fold metallo-hydrolase, partial [Burkholderiaceae bacterium]|nr:MBL fold metallo-hydrolase [Burkholderiaceae bacterium]
MTTAREALEGVSFLQRGWLSSNNVLLHGAPGEGATLVDSGHCAHAEQTVALVRHALAGEPLARLVNTHLHSDHCGGNAALQRAFAGLPVWIPPGQREAVQRWDEDALSYRPTRQRCERFTADATYAPGSTLRCGGRAWEVLAAPGHDPDSVILFDAAHGVLISADALWENGFGVVFPELEGEAAYDDVAAVLDLIERLPVQWVLPGHGAPFGDVAAALARARSRLAGFRADPARHDRHAAKVLLKFHLLEERAQPLPELCAWLAAAPLLQGVWQRLGRPGASVE